MTRWEYKTAQTHEPMDEWVLREYGDEGWILCTETEVTKFRPHAYCEPTDTHYFIARFRRPVQED